MKILSEPEITAKNLAQFSAVVLGIRAYNTQETISNWLPELFAYVKNGGVAIAQYNTLAELKTNQLGPYSLEISRDRVTDENAEVRYSGAEPSAYDRAEQDHVERFSGMASGTRTLFSQEVGSCLDTAPVVQRSKGKAA